MDMQQGYNQIEVLSEDKHKTAFWGSNQRWQWVVMPFGHKNAGSTFQRAMDDALEGQTNSTCYIDDMLVFNKSFKEHLQHLSQVFNVISKVGVKSYPSNCIFGASEVPYLGHMLSGNGINPQSAKVAAIAAIATLVDVTRVCAFQGLQDTIRNLHQTTTTL